MGVGRPKAESQMAENRFFSYWPNMQMAESQWAECSNGRNWPNPDQVDLHSRALVSVHLIWIWPISPSNRLAKKELQGSVENFHFFQEKSRVLYEFMLF
jgi:hypothetical protein